MEIVEKERVLKLVEDAGTWGWSKAKLYDEIDALPAVEKHHSYWAEHTGEDAGFHYCFECRKDAFNYQDGESVVEVLSDYCPYCGLPMSNTEC